MVSVFFGLALLLGQLAPATCPDLSGLYVLPGEDGHVEIIVSQAACLRVTVVWQIRNYDSNDREEYSASLDAVLRADTVNGVLRPEAMGARFRGDTLEFLTRPVNAATPSRAQRIKWFYRRADGDLCVGSSDSGGWTAMAGLVDRRGLAAAAARAESANNRATRSCR